MRTLLPLILALLFSACDDGETSSPPLDATSNLDSSPADAAPDATLAGHLEVSATALGFGAVAVGATKALPLTIENTGEGEATVTAISVGTGFGVSRTPPVSVPAGASRTLEVSFSPTNEGPVEDALVLTTAEGTVTVALAGEGVLPAASLVEPRLDLGVVAPGEPAAAFIKVQNTGTVRVIAGAVDGLAAPFVIPAGQLPATAEVGATAQILVQFLPTEEGFFEQAVAVQTDAGPLALTLVGRAVAEGSLSLRAVEPAFAFEDEGRRLVVHGGPFPEVPTLIQLGGVALTELVRLDDSRVAGWLPPGAPLGPQDIRVELPGRFGVLTGAVIITPPEAEGRALDEAALASGEVGPDGNPWRLSVDAIPEDATLVVAPGTVVLGEGELAIAGVIRAGGPAAVTVFDGFSHLAFAANPQGSSLTRVSLAGAAVTSAQALTLSDLALHGGAGLVVEAGGTVVVLGAVLTDLPGAAIRVEAPIFRLERAFVRRAGSPVAGAPQWFAAGPLGQGQDFADCALNAVELTGQVEGAVSLGAQPLGVAFGVRDGLTVAADGRLSLPGSVPLVLDGPVSVEGELSLGEGLIATGAGHLEILGRLTVDGARLEGVTASVSGELVGQGLTSVGAGSAERPALALSGTYTGFDGLTIQGSPGVGLALLSDGALTGLALSGNAGGLSLEGGTGRLEGQSRDQPAVSGAACSAWDLSALVDEDGQSVTCSE